MVLRIPGFEVPGYLSALAVGSLLLITAPCMGYSLKVPGALKNALISAVSAASILFLGSLSVALFNALFWPVCNPGLAAAFWILGPAFGSFFGVALGMSLRAHTVKLPRWVGPLALFILFIASLCWHLHRIYTQPAVAFFHPIVGNFSGPIYERNPTIGLSYILHRFWWSGAFLLFFSSWISARSRVLWLGGVWLLVGFGLRSPLGIDIDRADIVKELSAVEEGEYIRLRASRGWHTPQELNRLAKVLDFHTVEICEWLGIPLPKEKTEVFLFRNREQKRKLTGAGDTEIAKPWLNEIYVKEANPDAPVLRHELAHALSAPIASGPLAVPFRKGWIPNMPLVEGLATAVTWERGAFTPHEWTALARELGLTPSLEELFNPAVFWRNYGPLAYSMSASFVAWFRESYGRDALQAVYSGEGLEEVSSSTIVALEGIWHQKCLKESLALLTPESRLLADEILSKKPAYRRPCGLEIESIMSEAMDHGRIGQLDEALALIDGVVERSGGDPQLKMSRISAARLAGDPIAMVEMAKEILVLPEVKKRPRLEAKLRKQLADALWWLGAADAAMSAIQSLRLHLLSRHEARALWARRMLLARMEPGDELLLDYLTGRPMSGEAMDILHEQAFIRPSDSMVQYLYAFRLQGRGANDLAADAFEKVGSHFGFPRVLAREAAYRAGIGWYGKNTNLLLPDRGSWFVLGSVITNANFPPDIPNKGSCGTCERCIPACPTQAITAPGVLDANRCLAWLLQSEGQFPIEFREALGDRIYGCDDCQISCPPNRREERMQENSVSENFSAPVLIHEMLEMSDDMWHSSQ